MQIAQSLIGGCFSDRLDTFLTLTSPVHKLIKVIIHKRSIPLISAGEVDFFCFQMILQDFD